MNAVSSVMLKDNAPWQHLGHHKMYSVVKPWNLPYTRCPQGLHLYTRGSICWGCDIGRECCQELGFTSVMRMTTTVLPLVVLKQSSFVCILWWMPMGRVMSGRGLAFLCPFWISLGKCCACGANRSPIFYVVEHVVLYCSGLPTSRNVAYSRHETR